MRAKTRHSCYVDGGDKGYCRVNHDVRSQDDVAEVVAALKVALRERCRAAIHAVDAGKCRESPLTSAAWKAFRVTGKVVPMLTETV